MSGQYRGGPRVIEVMAWHPLAPGSERHASRIDATRPGASPAPDLALIDPDEWDWQDRALCAETDPEIFFPHPGAEAAPMTAAAKQVCLACEVREQCLDFAVREGIAYGVYGGMDERERRPLGTQHYDFRPARDRNNLAA